MRMRERQILLSLTRGHRLKQFTPFLFFFEPNRTHGVGDLPKITSSSPFLITTRRAFIPPARLLFLFHLLLTPSVHTSHTTHPQNPIEVREFFQTSEGVRNGVRREGQGLAVVGRGAGRPERQEAEAGPALQRLRGQAGGRRARCVRRHLRRGGGRLQGRGHPQDGRLRSPLPPLLLPSQPACPKVQRRPLGLRRLRGGAAGEPVPALRPRRRVRPGARDGRRRLGGAGRVPARRLRPLRPLLRGQRPQDRLPPRAVLLHGARVHLRSAAVGARRAPRRRARHARAQGALRPAQPDPGARAGPAAPPASRGRRRRVPPHRQRARPRHRRVGRLCPRGRLRAAAVHGQDVGQRAAIYSVRVGAEPQDGHRAGGRGGDEHRDAGRRRAGGPDVVPGGAAVLPGRRCRVQGAPSPHPHREERILIRLLRS